MGIKVTNMTILFCSISHFRFSQLASFLGGDQLSHLTMRKPSLKEQGQLPINKPTYYHGGVRWLDLRQVTFLLSKPLGYSHAQDYRTLNQHQVIAHLSMQPLALNNKRNAPLSISSNIWLAKRGPSKNKQSTSQGNVTQLIQA